MVCVLVKVLLNSGDVRFGGMGFSFTVSDRRKLAGMQIRTRLGETIMAYRRWEMLVVTVSLGLRVGESGCIVS